MARPNRCRSLGTVRPNYEKDESGDDRADRESEQGALGEGRLHPDRGEHAGERRGAGRRPRRRSRRCAVLDLGCGDGTTALPAARLGADVLGVDIAANLVAAGNERAAAAGLGNLHFEEGDASDLDGLDDDSFDLVVSIFGAMFAPRAVRRRQGDGAGDEARRPDRDGQLDPRRPDPRRPAAEDQRRLLAAATGGLRQPGHLGRGGRGARALRRRRYRARAALLSAARRGPSSTPGRRASSSPSSATITARR